MIRTYIKYPITADPTPKYRHNIAFIIIESRQAPADVITNNLVCPYAKINAFPGVVCICIKTVIHQTIIH